MDFNAEMLIANIYCRLLVLQVLFKHFADVIFTAALRSRYFRDEGTEAQKG